MDGQRMESLDMDLNYQWLVTLCAENGKSFHQVVGHVLKSLPKPDPNDFSFGKRYTPPTDECFVGTKVIADFLNISERTLRDWCVDNRVTYYKPNPQGGNFLFKLSQIKADMEKIKVQSKWKN